MLSTPAQLQCLHSRAGSLGARLVIETMQTLSLILRPPPLFVLWCGLQKSSRRPGNIPCMSVSRMSLCPPDIIACGHAMIGKGNQSPEDQHFLSILNETTAYFVITAPPI